MHRPVMETRLKTCPVRIQGRGFRRAGAVTQSQAEGNLRKRAETKQRGG